MARKYTKKTGKVTYGKSFAKKTSSGKFKKGTKIQYKYQNGRRVGARKAPSRR
jgi:hypothetical protein